MKKNYGILAQIMALFILVAVIMSALLFSNIKLLSGILEEQHSQALAMMKNEEQHDAEMIAASQDEKIALIATTMQMIAPELIWEFNLPALELFATTYRSDTDVSSVTFLDENGKFMVGDNQPKGTKTLTRELILEGEKLGSIVIGINSDHLAQRLNEIHARSTDFEQTTHDEILKRDSYQRNLIIFTVCVFLLVLLTVFVVVKNIIGPVAKLSGWARNVASGDYSLVDIDAPKNEIGELNTNFRQMVDKLRETAGQNQKNNWLKTGQSQLDTLMRGASSIEDLCREVITFLANYLEAHIGAFYVHDGQGLFVLTGSYAYTTRKGHRSQFEIGKGLVGQAAFEKQSILFTSVPVDYLTVSSGLGEKAPDLILVVPLIYNDNVTGVMELATFGEFTDIQREFIVQAAETIAITINTIQAGTHLKGALNESQQLAEELASQQAELRASNEELEDQTKRLQASEEELRAQQEELQASNEELQEKSCTLENQRKEVDLKNQQLLSAQSELEKKAKDLEITSKYKSEFLANMSHELRTPLNSLLILAHDLKANRQDNLEEEQIESADIIYNSGNDLLKLINEILDLSKIEAGKISLHLEDVSLPDIIGEVKTNFQHVAKDKGIELGIEMDESLPETVQTDHQRLGQIIKNLMSNAIKFTEQGSVSVKVHRPSATANLSSSGLDKEKAVAISVTDTGIGIPQEKIVEIFEAFQQVDGSISRQYGGTGLGLSISRELARLLGGELQVESTLGKGSTFSVYIPSERERRKAVDRRKSEENQPTTGTAPERTTAQTAGSAPRPAPQHIKDDRDAFKDDDRVILVIEDDMSFAAILYKFSHESGFKCIHAGDGETGIELALNLRPSAIILDIKLPGIQGWEVLDALKNNDTTRHIPVHMMSADEMDINAFKKGVIGYLTKPVKRDELEQAFIKIGSMLDGNLKKLLIVEDDEGQRKSIIRLIGHSDVETTSVGTGGEAITLLHKETYDCVILDLKLPDMTGFDLLKQLDTDRSVSVPPIIVYTGKEIDKDEQAELEKYTSSIIIKGVKSPERLLDETALFLHRVIEDLPKDKQKMIASLHGSENRFAGKKILLVDDDMRNVFALSKILSKEGMEVLKAANGKMALDLLASASDVDLVLMDIMMPVMDGYTAMKAIRNLGTAQRNVPILALTAKAMAEDRQKCIESGANDYLPKPVDVDRLLSLLRVWLHR